jgi:hypothetical protein
MIVVESGQGKRTDLDDTQTRKHVTMVRNAARAKTYQLSIPSFEPPARANHAHNIPDMSGLADYLAKNYLTADSDKKSKKRKRKNKDAGLIIDDDDNLVWKEKADKDDEDAPMIGMNLSDRSIHQAY